MGNAAPSTIIASIVKPSCDASGMTVAGAVSEEGDFFWQERQRVGEEDFSSTLAVG